MRAVPVTTVALFTLCAAFVRWEDEQTFARSSIHFRFPSVTADRDRRSGCGPVRIVRL
jgi:hypothetical protein